MKIYRITYRDFSYEHKGYEFTTNKAKAKSLQSKNNKLNGIEDDVDEFEFPISAAGMLAALNQLASHLNNG